MNRRDFLKRAGGLLATVPTLAWLKKSEVNDYSPSLGLEDIEVMADEIVIGPDDTVYIGGAFVSDDYPTKWESMKAEFED